MKDSMVVLFTLLIATICYNSLSRVHGYTMRSDTAKLYEKHSRKLQQDPVQFRFLLTLVDFQPERSEEAAYAAPVTLVELDISSFVLPARNGETYISLPPGFGRCMAGQHRHSYCRLTTVPNNEGVIYTGYRSLDGTITSTTPRQIVKYNLSGELEFIDFSSTSHYTAAASYEPPSRFVLASHAGLHNLTVGSENTVSVVLNPDGSPTSYNVSGLWPAIGSDKFRFLINKDEDTAVIGAYSSQNVLSYMSGSSNAISGTIFRVFGLNGGNATLMMRGNGLTFRSPMSPIYAAGGAGFSTLTYSKEVILIPFGANMNYFYGFAITRNNRIVMSNCTYTQVNNNPASLTFSAVTTVYIAPAGTELQGMAIRPLVPSRSPSATPSIGYTQTSSASSTQTSSSSSTATSTETSTYTHSFSASSTATISLGASPSRTPSTTSTVSITPTGTPTSTSTLTVSPTATLSKGASPSNTGTASPTPSNTPSVSFSSTPGIDIAGIIRAASSSSYETIAGALGGLLLIGILVFFAYKLVQYRHSQRRLNILKSADYASNYASNSHYMNGLDMPSGGGQTFVYQVQLNRNKGRPNTASV